jgi:hypothetical protein
MDEDMTTTAFTLDGYRVVQALGVVRGDGGAVLRHGGHRGAAARGRRGGCRLNGAQEKASSRLSMSRSSLKIEGEIRIRSP